MDPGRVEGTHSHLSYQYRCYFFSGEVFWVSPTMSNFFILLFYTTIALFAGTRHSSNLPRIGPVSMGMQWMPARAQSCPARGQDRIWVLPPVYSKHLALSVAHSGFSMGSSGKRTQTQFCFYLHTMWKIPNCPLLLHRFFFQIIHFHPLPSPHLTPQHDPWQQWREYLLNTYGVRWFTFIFVVALKFSKSCKLNTIIFTVQLGN